MSTTPLPDQWQTDAADTEYDPAPVGDTPTQLDTGDKYDDDGRVLDSLVQPAAEPAPRTDAPKVPTEPSTIQGPRPATRLRTETTTPAPDGLAVQLVGRNPDRKQLQVRFTGTDVAFMLADDRSKVSLRMGAYYVAPPATGSTQLDLDEHTGPLFVAVVATGGAPSSLVSIVEVTS